MSGKATLTKMTFKALAIDFKGGSRHRAANWPGYQKGSSLILFSQAIFMIYFFKPLPFQEAQRAQVHRVLTKDRSCTDQHVFNEATFARDSGLTSSPF